MATTGSATTTESPRAEVEVDAGVLSIMPTMTEDAEGEGGYYEPWLFQTMLGVLADRELGIGFIYSVLDLLAQRHGLSDVVVVVRHESFGTQMFRLGGEVVTPDVVARVGAEPGLYCEPDNVPQMECDAVRTACHVALSLHLARFSASHDWLTNIANRRSFEDALDSAAARSSRYDWAFTLILLDLNDFKKVNDRDGHMAGDVLLKQFGFALRQAVRSGDTVARIGGDEFAVILSKAEGHDSSDFVERLRKSLIELGNYVEFTIGTALAPRDSTDPGELYGIADHRLRKRKGGGRT